MNQNNQQPGSADMLNCCARAQSLAIDCAEHGFTPAYAAPSPQIAEDLPKPLRAVLVSVGGRTFHETAAENYYSESQLRAIAASRRAAAEPMYQIYDPARDAWDTYVKEDYDNTPDDARRIVYAAPPASLPDVAMPASFAWPSPPARKGQSNVLFDDGYEEGWAKAIDTVRSMIAAQPAEGSAQSAKLEYGEYVKQCARNQQTPVPFSQFVAEGSAQVAKDGLLPCPFCAHEAKLVDNGTGSFRVACPQSKGGCGASTRMSFDKGVTARAEWNRRSLATPAAVVRAAPAEMNRRDILGICDAYESGIGHGLKMDGHSSGAIFGNPEHGNAYEIGYMEGVRRASHAAEGATPAGELTDAERAFVELVAANPGKKLGHREAFDADDNPLWRKPEQLGLIECLGSYKWRRIDGDKHGEQGGV